MGTSLPKKKTMGNIDLAVKVAWSFHGTFYIWGGDDPSGFDCSGLVVEILKSVGILHGKDDYTAQGLYNKFKNNESNFPQTGYLVFWGRDTNHITHVEFCITEWHTIGASGGGSKTKTEQDAIDQNAYVKVRPIRPGVIKIVNPFL